MAKTLARVHTHTHTQGNLINKKRISGMFLNLKDLKAYPNS